MDGRTEATLLYLVRRYLFAFKRNTILVIKVTHTFLIQKEILYWNIHKTPHTNFKSLVQVFKFIYENMTPFSLFP